MSDEYDLQPTASKLMDTEHSRAPKLLGDFGEGLATYALIRKGFEVACVDHVGADLIAEKDSHKIAVSVKTRMYKAGSQETRGTVLRSDHLEKLKHFAQRFDLEPVLAHVVCIVDERVIHLFVLRVADVEAKLDKVKHGYRLRFGPHQLQNTISLPFVDYSSWSDEHISAGLLFDSHGTI